MTNPIGVALEAYDHALAGHHGELHLHLAPGFADAFVDRGEGHDPLVVRNLLGPGEDDRVRRVAVEAYASANPHAEELHVQTDLGSLIYTAQPVDTVTGSPPDRFTERVRQFTRFRRAQKRLERAASFYGGAIVVALASLAAFPLAFELDASDLVGLLLVLTPVALPWAGVLVVLLQFKALGVTQGMGALQRQPGEPFFTPVSAQRTHGRRTVLAWLGWAGAYVVVVGSALAVFVAVGTSDDTWGAPSAAETVGGALLAAGMVFASAVMALLITYAVALMMGVLATTIVDGHDDLFESRRQRTGLGLVLSFLPASVVWIVLHAFVHDHPWQSGRGPITVATNIVNDWQAGPTPGTTDALLGAYWLSGAVALGLLVSGTVLGVRDRIARRRPEEPEPPRTYPHPWTT